MTTPPATVDLNSDMGEGFGAWRIGDDAAILRIVTSANVACGFHAGDPDVMDATFRDAKANGVAVGAHPGYADLPGFGRRVIPHSTAEIERLIAYQVGAAQAMSALAGHPIAYVKTHGALANQAETDPDVAAAVTRAVKAVDPRLTVLAIALGQQDRIAREMGLRVMSEIFADRAYTEDGHLVSRRIPGAVIHDAEAAAARAVRMVRGGMVETLSGASLPARVDSVCVHGDTPSAITIAMTVRRGLEAAGIAVRSFSSAPAPT